MSSKVTKDNPDGPLRGFFAMSVGRPVAMMVCFATLIVLGVISYQRLSIQLLPDDFSEPSVQMWISNPNSSAQENEERIARVIEEQLRTMTGIREVWSWSNDSSVQMGISFDPHLDMDLAKAEVRDRLERARPQFPETVGEIGMWSESASALPITFFGISLDGDPDRRDFLMEKVVLPRLEAVEGIGNVDIWGITQDSVRILLDEDKVAAAQLDLGSVIGRLMRDNFAMPLGELDDGGREFLLRSDMRFKTVEEIGEFPVGDGIKLKDLGRVARVKSASTFLSKINGKYAFYGMATKDSQSNVVETSDNFAAAMEALQRDPKLVGQIDSKLFFLQGDLVKSALSQLTETAMWGGILAVIVLFVFLRRVRLTLCVALCIPVSALLALSWEYFTGGTFNVLTMTGITLAMGMLVDNAVVVIENIARIRQGGASGARAAIIGSRQIALAVTLATLTTVVVFLPLIFMTDTPNVRVLLGGMGIPLCISLVASLLIAVVFLPVIASKILGDRPKFMERSGNFLAPVLRLPTRLVAWIIGGLRWAWGRGTWLMFWFNRVFLNVVCFRVWRVRPVLWIGLAGLIVLAAGRLGRTAPSYDSGSSLEPFGVLSGGGEEALAQSIGSWILLAIALVVVSVIALPHWLKRSRKAPRLPARLVPQGNSLIEMMVAFNQRLVSWTLEHRILATVFSVLALASIIVPFGKLTSSPSGEGSAGNNLNIGINFDTNFTLAEADEEIRVYEDFFDARREEYGIEDVIVRFNERGARVQLFWEERVPIKELLAIEKEIQKELPRIPGHEPRFYDENASDQNTNAVVAFRLVGPDYTALERYGEEAAKILESVNGLSQVSNPLEQAPDQIRVEIDRDKAHDLGVDTQAVEQSISYALRGFPLPRFQEEGREIPFLIEYDEEETAGVPTLRDLNIFSDGAMVPLSTFADLAFTKGSRGIFRRDGKISFTLEAKVDDPLQVIPVTERAYAALGQLEMPRGYYFDRGDSVIERRDEEFGALYKALFLSVVLVFLVMGILFESVLLPFSVLFTVPFALCGAFWTLWLTNTPLDPMAVIGMIILAGVVVNNGIVLIDRIHNLRSEYPDRSEAVIVGCAQRVRPVLMTALTTVCGLLPMIFAAPPSDGIDYRALAKVVAGGLVCCTFFTLWVVPLAYTLIDDLKRSFKTVFHWWVTMPRRYRIRRRLAREAEFAAEA